MEGYQTAGVIVGLVSTIIWVFLGFFVPILWIPAIIAFVFMFTALADVKHHTSVGVVWIFVAIFANFLYIIPAILALVYKTKEERTVYVKHDEPDTTPE